MKVLIFKVLDGISTARQGPGCEGKREEEKQ